MCGRYTLSTPPDLVAELTGVQDPPEWEARYNIAPTQEAPVVRTGRAGGREMGMLRWGLVPFWAEDPSVGSPMINARSESVAEKPAFRRSLERRRCLVPADGFYEWKRTPRGKQPFYVHFRERQPFVFAGLWDRWRDEDGEALESFTILTTEPNELVRPLHDRMPVILAPDAFEEWLSTPPEEAAGLTGLFAPPSAEAMAIYPVSTYVNNPANDSPRCVEEGEVEEEPRNLSLF